MFPILHIVLGNGHAGSKVHHFPGSCIFQLPLVKGFSVVFAMLTRCAAVIGINSFSRGDVLLRYALPQCKGRTGVSTQDIRNAMVFTITPSADKIQAIAGIVLIQIQ